MVFVSLLGGLQVYRHSLNIDSMYFHGLYQVALERGTNLYRDPVVNAEFIHNGPWRALVKLQGACCSKF